MSSAFAISRSSSQYLCQDLRIDRAVHEPLLQIVGEIHEVAGQTAQLPCRILDGFPHVRAEIRVPRVA